MSLLFRRSKKQGLSAAESAGDEEPQLYRIEFDMMVKGSICKRRKGPVRQFGVTVNGSTRLVTSGDMVDRDTYRALLAAGALRVDPVAGPAGGQRKRNMDFTGAEPFEE